MTSSSCRKRVAKIKRCFAELRPFVRGGIAAFVKPNRDYAFSVHPKVTSWQADVDAKGPDAARRAPVVYGALCNRCNASKDQPGRWDEPAFLLGLFVTNWESRRSVSETCGSLSSALLPRSAPPDIPLS